MKWNQEWVSLDWTRCISFLHGKSILINSLILKNRKNVGTVPPKYCSYGSLFCVQDWSGIVDQSQAGGDQYHVGDFIYVMPAESSGTVPSLYGRFFPPRKAS